jgi:hypothetical protein
MRSKTRVWILTALNVAVIAGSADAQAASRNFTQPASPATAAPTAQAGASPTGFSAFGLEALGASVGSALGFGIIYLTRKDECDVEDLSCNLESAFAAIVVGSAGAAAGDYIVGKLFDTRPSAVGAIVGAVAGAAAGVGTWHLFKEELGIVNTSEGYAATYVITQGVVTALGSRLVRALK